MHGGGMMRGLAKVLLHTQLLVTIAAVLPRELITAPEDLGAPAASAQPWRSVPVDPATNVLAGLPALPKVHHSWPLAVNWTDPRMQPILLDYARITHAVGLSMEDWGVAQDVINAAVRICAKTEAIIEFTYTPWGTDESPFPRHALPTYEGPEEAAELALFTKKCSAAARAIKAANAQLSTAVKFGGILFDQERWCSDCFEGSVNYLNITNMTSGVKLNALSCFSQFSCRKKPI
jgi:hypothetical protein